MPRGREGRRRRHLLLPTQEELAVVAGKAVVERRDKLLVRSRGLDEPRGHDDDEIRLLSLEGSAAQQRAKNRNLADPGQLTLVLDVVGLQEASHGKTLAVAQLDSRARAPDREAGDLHATDVERVDRIELAYLGLYFEVDQTIAKHCRCE